MYLAIYDHLRGKTSFVILVCAFIGVVMATLVFQLYSSHQRALAELDALQATSTKLENVHQLALQVEELRRFSILNKGLRFAQSESRFMSLYSDIQTSLNDLEQIITQEEHLPLIGQMKDRISLYRDSYQQAVNSKTITEKIIQQDLADTSQEICSQISSSPSKGNSLAQIVQLIELTRLNLTAYSYRADAISEEGILQSIEFIRAQIEASPEIEDKTLVLATLNEYQQLANQVVSQTQNYLYLTNVVLAGHANEYVYLLNRMKSFMHEEFAQESEVTRNQLNLAKTNTQLLSLALLLVVVGSMLALGYFLYRLELLEKNLRESSRRHKLIIDQANTGIAEVALDGSWIQVNEKICQMFGYTEAELTSLTWQDITHPDDLAIDNSLVQKIIDGEINQYTLDKRYIAKDGSVFWARLKVSAHKDDKGQLLNFISTVENIDDLKRQENLLLETNTGLEKQVAQRLIDLERSNAELEQFAYVASHDLQEPLRMVSSYMQLVEDRYKDKLDDDGKEFINFAVDGALRMQTLIKSLLEYSRVGTDQGARELVDMEAVVDIAEQNLASVIKSSQAVITHDPLPEVFGNKSQLTQLIQNLISNAIKYAKRDISPKIHISASKSGQKWLFLVQDNGIGFDEVHSEKIFVIFRRLHTKEEYAGTGIGLAICKKIVERHGGTIWVKSTPGEGSTFYFTLNSLEDQ